MYQDKIPAEEPKHSSNDPNFCKALKELHGVNVKIEILKNRLNC